MQPMAQRRGSMDKFVIDATEYTPYICFDPDQHVLDIKGKSYPENTTTFYEPVFKWLVRYFPQLTDEEVTVNIEIIYFNSSSSKILLDFFDLLDEAAFRGVDITVNWFYEPDDEDMREYGEEFEEDFRTLRFQFVERTATE
jgi:hypothetical protein